MVLRTRSGIARTPSGMLVVPGSVQQRKVETRPHHRSRIPYPLLISCMIFILILISALHHVHIAWDDFDYRYHRSIEVVPRAFPVWEHSLEELCLKPESRWFGEAAQASPIKRGLFFVKLYKAASSTAAGIHLRISRGLARRLHPDEEKDWPICKSRFDHNMATVMKYKERTRTDSFLWTVVRNPTERAMSHYFHFTVARNKLVPSDEGFREDLLHTTNHDYYLTSLSVTGYSPRDRLRHHENIIPQEINGILSAYDFIGVAERMDETAVALKLILNIPMADILFLSAKRSGGYDNGMGRSQCTYIPPRKLSEGMDAFIQGDKWKSFVANDQKLYEAANKSLDLTIAALGKTTFEQELQLFRKAQFLAEERCLLRANFPCDANGIMLPRDQRDCLWNDSGCGKTCLDEIATELNLWNA